MERDDFLDYFQFWIHQYQCRNTNCLKMSELLKELMSNINMPIQLALGVAWCENWDHLLRYSSEDLIAKLKPIVTYCKDNYKFIPIYNTENNIYSSSAMMDKIQNGNFSYFLVRTDFFQYHKSRVKDAGENKISITIDLNDDIDILKLELETIYYNNKLEMARYFSYPSEDLVIDEKYVGEIEYLESALEDVSKKLIHTRIKKEFKAGYRSEKYTRIAGLWLFDYIKQNGCTIKKAVAEFFSRHDLKKIGLEETEYTDFCFYLRQTKACIDTTTVLPFTKRKSGTQKRKLVPGTQTAK